MVQVVIMWSSIAPQSRDHIWEGDRELRLMHAISMMNTIIVCFPTNIWLLKKNNKFCLLDGAVGFKRCGCSQYEEGPKKEVYNVVLVKAQDPAF